MSGRHAIFLINLLQDVNIVRPLVFLARRELGLPVLLLLSHKFVERDEKGIWRAELDELRVRTGSALELYDSEYSALRRLQGKHGVLISASESNLGAHVHTHNVFRVAPPGFLKVTLQHGFECVGFLQNRDHDKAHGRNVRFGADVICGWCDLSVMRSVAPSERSKYLLTGPSALLRTEAPASAAAGDRDGLVCENLHSVRMRMYGDFKASFIDTFRTFCAELSKRKGSVGLRPHPGGQYVVKNAVELPDNAHLVNQPIYKVDLRDHVYGISAPSSVLIDMVLAGIPAAVWQDTDGLIDSDNYRGLTTVSELDDWLAFERDARLRPSMLLRRQSEFLQRSRLLTDATTVERQFSSVLAAAWQVARLDAAAEASVKRVFFIANGMIPTLQLSFLEPLKADVAAGRVALDMLTAEDLRERFLSEGELLTGAAEERAKEWIAKRIADFRPDLIVFCRYSGYLAHFMTALARARGVPTIFHVDDDLLNIPVEIGRAKHRAHNRPWRLEAVRHLLETSDLVYASTDRLSALIREQGFETRIFTGPIYCAGEVLRRPVLRPAIRIGYMGFDHENDFRMILPALVDLLRRREELTFDLFGSIPKPPALVEFGDRIHVIPPVRGYSDFMNKFATLDWDIGLCPLADLPFNRVKANTKWVEYTAVGAAVIATRGMAYDECCSYGAGVLAGDLEEWAAALERLCSDAAARYEMVLTAQDRVRSAYSAERLRQQVWSVFKEAADLRRGGSMRDVA